MVINNHLRRARGGKVSYTHIIGYAMVQALKTVPAMNNGYDVIDGKPTWSYQLMSTRPRHRPAQGRWHPPALVPSIKSELDFAEFWSGYEQMVKKARAGKLTLEDFAGTTITLTNPGPSEPTIRFPA